MASRLQTAGIAPCGQSGRPPLSRLRDATFTVTRQRVSHVKIVIPCSIFVPRVFFFCAQLQVNFPLSRPPYPPTRKAASNARRHATLPLPDTLPQI